MSVLTDIFGAHVECGAWGRERELPLYIATGYAFSTVKINGYKFILISPKEELVTLPALKKQMERIKNVENIPVAIHLSSISLYRRKKLFENGIPFLTQKQAYLPFLGTYLTNESHEEKGLSKFLFSTQQLVLLFLYSDSKKLYVSDATKYGYRSGKRRGLQ